MTAVNKQQFTGLSTLPTNLGGISKSYTGRGYTSGSTKVYLPDGYLWSHVSVYGISDGGAAGDQSAAVIVYYKDGTSTEILKYNGHSVYSSSPRTVYIESKLTQVQIANIDYIYCSAFAKGGKNDNGDEKTGYSGAYVYGMKIPWVSE